MQAASTATTDYADFRFDRDYDLSDLGGSASRFRFNVAAITLLKRLEAESRSTGDLTLEEGRTLSRYSGWGDSDALGRAFPNGAYSWSRPCGELEESLTPDEIKSLLASSLNAHFTSLPIIRAIYAALDHFGLAPHGGGRILELDSGQSVALGLSGRTKLRILEPSAGVGHFLGAMPQWLNVNCERVAVEIDSLTGRMLARLYPQTRVFIQPFEETPLPENYFDLVISNVPFGNYAVADGSIRESFLKASIHDYYFAKSLRLVKPGGLIAFITSLYTLDKKSPKVRQYLAAHAELLAAARLPRNAFRANAGTQVVTDVLILRKRIRPSRELQVEWVETGETALRNGEGEERDISINNLYIRRPEWMLGRPGFGRGMYEAEEFLLHDDGRDLARSLAETLIAQLPADGYRALAAVPSIEESSATSDQEDFLAAASSGGLSERDQACVNQLLDIYIAAKEVIRLQLRDAPDEELKAKQSELSEIYTSFKMRFGAIHRNVKKLSPHSPVVPFLKALEVPAGKDIFNRAPIFSERTIRPARRQSGRCEPKEALLISLNDKGWVDPDYIVRLCERSREEVLSALEGLVYETPCGEYVTAEEYLSGDVRQKLREVELAAEFNLDFAKNVEALRAVQPTNLGRDEIIVRLGAAWVPEVFVGDFISSIAPSFSGSVRHIPALAVWKVENISAWARSSVEARQTWGTSRVNAFELIEDILNLRTTTVTDEVQDPDGSARRVVNDNETIAAQAKQLEIKQKFAEWIWLDESRAATLIRIYNERFNAFRKREYDGGHLSLPGMSADITLYRHQMNAIWRCLQDKATLLAHCVGAGKTFTMIAAAMELKRLGLCHKSLIVVPNHLPAQWAAEAIRLYPNIRLLAPEKEHLTSSQRGELLSRIATSEFDAIILPQTAFKMLPLNPETVRDYIQREIDTLTEYLEEFESAGSKNKRSVKEVQRAIKKLKARLDNTNQQIKRVSAEMITWDELGIDALYIDEFHCFKNLYCPTKMSRVAGLPNVDSQRAFDCFMKVRSVLENGGRVVCATATPVSNTIAEVYVCQKYLQLETLQELGLEHFDAWVQQFAETTQSLEMTPDGSGFRMNTRFNRFTNIPELSKLWQQVLDVKPASELNLPRPKLKGGRPEIVSVPASDELKEYVRELARRVEAIKARRVSPHMDNMLKVTGDGRKAALDIRLVKPDAPRPAQSKVMALVENIMRLYRETQESRGVQCVFLDVSTPRGKGNAFPSARGRE
jgi:N12 class adenine-specific DNA methylase